MPANLLDHIHRGRRALDPLATASAVLRSLVPPPVTLTLLAFLTATTALSAAGFLVGVGVSQWQAMAALFLSGAACFVGRGSVRQHMHRAATVFGVLALAVFVSGLSVMYAIPDAEGYHRPAAQLIAHGWNPVFDATHERLTNLLGPDPGMRLWHTAYLPRGLWIFSAAMYRVTGFVESGDAFSVILLIVCYQLVTTLLLRATDLGRGYCQALALLVSISPVVPWQILGGGNDSAFYSLFMICVCATTLFCMSGRWTWLLYPALGLPLLVNLKFSGVLVAIALGLVGSVAIVFGRSGGRVAERFGQWWLALFHAAALGAVIGFSPYVTNWVNHGGPFYPKKSFDKRVVVEDRITSDFQDMNDDARQMGWLGRFCSAYVSDTLAQEYYKRTIRPDFNPIINVNGGVKGFGVVFRVAFVVSIVALALLPMGWLRLPIATILLTVAMQPLEYVGYARYVSQFYTLPIFVLAGVLSYLRSQVVSARAATAAVGRLLRHYPAASRLLPRAAIALTVLLYAIPLCASSCSWLALQWIVSVQNIEIIDAMRRDDAPRLFAATYYSRHSLTTDSGIPGIQLLDSSHADRDQHGMWHVRDLPGYTPCSSYFDLYTYFSPKDLPSLPRLTHVLSRDDPGVKASRDRRNARFFVYDFLPRQLPRLPQYLWRVMRFRGEQLGRTWLGTGRADLQSAPRPQLAPAL